MNKSKGNMYEWLTHTWNPLSGECLHGCSYCSTNKLMRYPGIKKKYTGLPRLHEKEINANLGNDNFIFVCAQNDLFANEVSKTCIIEILEHCHKFKGNKYLFQTKNPKRILDFKNKTKGLDFTICTTIETNRFYPEIMENCPYPRNRAFAMNDINEYFGFKDPKNYVTVEPIMDFDLEHLCFLIETCKPKQVNLGLDSKGNNLPEPPKEKILALIERLSVFTKVELKSNLKRLMK